MALGIIAGSGKLPRQVADSCVKDKKDVFVVVLNGIADEDAFRDVPHCVARLGEAGKILKSLHQANVTDIVFAGAVRRPSFKEIFPDFRALQFFARVGTAFLGDNDLLSAVLKEVEKEGFHIIGIHEVLPSLLTPVGCLTKTKPSEDAMKAVLKGFYMAKEIGCLDIGQGVVIQDDLVLGVEAIEGTDALIERTALLRRKKGSKPVLVKVCKPQQEKRIDLPASGMQTLQNLEKFGFQGLALEAGATLMAEKNEMIDFADRHHLFIVGVDHDK